VLRLDFSLLVLSVRANDTCLDSMVEKPILIVVAQDN